MARRSPITSLIIGVMFAAAIGMAGFGFVSFQRDLDALDKAGQENISWSAMQLEIELLRFREIVHEYIAEDSASVRQVNRRFDILWSRISIFQAGLVGQRLTEYDTNGILIRLFAELHEQAEWVETLDTLDHAQLEALHEAFVPYSIELRNFSKTVFIGESQILSEIHMQMRGSANTTLTLSAVSVVLLLCGLGYSSWQGRRFKLLAKSNRKLADIADQASQSKTKFLTMMSHELRTPMNGVLGLLALLRQSKTTGPQKNLIDRAEKSAKQMIGMLTDILEFAALQNEEMSIEFHTFEPAQLTNELEELFLAEAFRAGIKFSVNTGENCPVRLYGDQRRLKQIYAQLIGYFLDLAGMDKIVLEFGYGNGQLSAEFQLDYGLSGASWTPDMVLGNRSDKTDGFAADALGPAVARGLIKKMGGNIRSISTKDNLVVLAVDIPVAKITQSTVNVRLEMTSEVMATICRTALRDSPVGFETTGRQNDTRIVLFETGGLDDSIRVAELRQGYPNALIVAIGRPIDAALFDETIEVPSQISSLMEPVIKKMAS